MYTIKKSRRLQYYDGWIHIRNGVNLMKRLKASSKTLASLRPSTLQLFYCLVQIRSTFIPHLSRLQLFFFYTPSSSFPFITSFSTFFSFVVLLQPLTPPLHRPLSLTPSVLLASTLLVYDTSPHLSVVWHYYLRMLQWIQLHNPLIYTTICS